MVGHELPGPGGGELKGDGSQTMHRNGYPFAAIVGQESLKQSLLIAAVNPAAGGVLIRGEKGTAKSTAVRGLADLLPEIAVVRGCPFACAPNNGFPDCHFCRQTSGRETTRRRVRVVDLPLNATEDRVAGGIDFSRAIRDGRRTLSPGLLADAHRSVLYVDEVNLLDDHIVDIILDAAASGENRVEREGISLRHPSRFILVGTMNPEEGELRPQLLDRFGLCVEVGGADAPEDRVRLMALRDEFDRDSAAFRERYRAESDRLARRLAGARTLLPRVRVPAHLRQFISELCTENHVAGHRADLVMEQAARALAALEGRGEAGGKTRSGAAGIEVTVDHVRTVAPLVLIHRRREVQPPPPPPPPPEPEPPEPEETDSPPDAPPEETPPQTEGSGETPEEQNAAPPESSDPSEAEDSPEESGAPELPEPDPRDALERIFEIGATFKVKPLAAAKDRVFRRGSGRRSRTRVSQKQGRYVKSAMTSRHGDIALDATLRAAAPYQKQRGRRDGLAVSLTPGDVRGKIREKRIGNFLLFVVDASGSMGARGRMAASKGAVMSLLLDAYQKRDRVGLISFRRNEATINLPPTPSVELAGKLLADMPVGGRTPLSAGLAKAHEQAQTVLRKDPSARPILILITDGKSNVALGDRKPVDESLRLAAAMAREDRVRRIVVDTEPAGPVTFGLAARLAAAMEAQYFKIDDLKAQTLVEIVKGQGT